MPEDLRGMAAIVGIGETEHRRTWAGRSMWGLCAEAAAEAIRDAGLAREDIDGLMTFGHLIYPAAMAEYIGIKPVHFGLGSGFAGSSSGAALTVAAHVVSSGMANYVMFVAGGARDPGNPDASIFMAPRDARPGPEAEWMFPYGMAAGAGTPYGLIYTRHMYRYGTKQEQLAQIAVNQRFNAQQNPRAAFRDQPLTVEDVLNSRYVNYPLHLLECVMPVAGAIAFIVTSADRAKTLRQPPAYVLGAGLSQGYNVSWLNPDLLEVPCKYSSKAAYAMSGYGPKEMQFAEFYD